MEIKTTTNQILKVLHILSWIIFIGLCIEAGGIVFNAIFTLLFQPEGAKKFWQEIDLSHLYNFDQGHFIAETLNMIIVAIMKSILFYLIIKILFDKKLNLNQPFTIEMEKFLSNMAYLSLGIGLFTYFGQKYTLWLISLGVKMPDINQLKFSGSDVWLFMGVTLLVIAKIFKKGVEIQAENDLTI